ncbi:hypothetical protein [Actinomadura sp. WMMB 499]|uniref:helix-turn-helix transcriptional regulator n=1 Tax=Actinomadura sp. WMMB 499 TaxID=1219491 RepID=UPI0012479BF2|nr:hypothetical protein [Actinomadura sp. WMMB 499]QFG22373.1 hypothetical protein F7P10_15800 [Actinomadura sp. WMMB 499]
MVRTVLVSAGGLTTRLLPRVPPRVLVPPGMLIAARRMTLDVDGGCARGDVEAMDDQRPGTVGTPWWGFDPVEQEIRELQRRLGALHTALDSVLETHPRTGPGRWARPEGSIRPLDGAVAVDTALMAAFAVARERMLVIRPSDLPTDRWLAATPVLLERGVAVNLLCPHSLRSDKALLGRLRKSLDEGAEVRTTGLPIVPMLLLDSATVFVPAWLEIKHPALAAHLDEIFTATWEQAGPLGPEPVPGKISEEIQVAVAKLLVAGLVDETIARRLGMSVRACRGHIAALCRRLGATSRAQLGFRIAVSGIIDEP